MKRPLKLRAALAVLSVAAAVHADSLPRVGVLTDTTPGITAPTIAALLADLKSQPVRVVELHATAIDVNAIDALVLPDATHSPTSLAPAINAMSRAGKTLVLIGPRPLSEAVERRNDRWLAAPTTKTGNTISGNAFSGFNLSFDGSTDQPNAISHLDGQPGAAIGLPTLSTDLLGQAAPAFAVPLDGQSALLPIVTSGDETVAALLNFYGGPNKGSRDLLVGIDASTIAKSPVARAWLAKAVCNIASNKLQLPASATHGRTDLPIALGSTSVGGGYRTMTDVDDLTEAAAKLHELGTHSIKLWFDKAEHGYPHTTFPPYQTLAELAQTPAFDKVFHDDSFSLIVLEAFAVDLESGYWKTPGTDASFANEQQQFHDLTAYLLKTFANTNKTFVLQNWEGDWAIRPKTDLKLEIEPSAADGMIKWLNARQAGIDSARAEIGEHGVHVRGAAEVNQVKSSFLQGKKNVIDLVIPHTTVDFVSYSSYDSERSPTLFRASLQYMASKLPPKPGIDGCRVVIGEYGEPETAAGLPAVKRTLKNAVDVSMAFGCPYAMYWELYCNESIRKPVLKNEDTRGFWLIKPDGTHAWAWDYLHDRIEGKNAE